MFGQGRPLVDCRDRSIFQTKKFVAMVLLFCCAHFNSSFPRASSSLLPQQAVLEQEPQPQRAESETKTPGGSTTFVAGNPESDLSPNIPETSEISGTSTLRQKKIRLRIYWGGGTPQPWTGTIRLKQGNFSNPQVLGVTADAAASVLTVNDQLQIKHWSATSFGGIDIDVPDTDANHLELSLDDGSESDLPMLKATVSLTEILQESYYKELDDTGNRIMISRVPGDFLPVQISRPHLIFTPQEAFEFSLAVNRIAWPSQKLSCRVRIQPQNSANPYTLAGIGTPKSSAISSNQASTQTLSFDIDSEGSASAQPVRLIMPNEEGVYQLTFELAAPWQQASLKPRNSVSRQIQVVVLNSHPPTNATLEPWKQIDSIDPTVDGTAASKSLLSLGLKSGSASATLGNDQRKTVTIDDQPMLELGVGGWVTVPLKFQRIDRPHRIEIEYLSDRPASLGFSLLETDADGQIPLYGYDSGLFVPPSLIDLKPKATTRDRQLHSFIVWPKEKSAQLLIANRDSLNSATIGQVTVFAGPARLPKILSPKGSDPHRRGNEPSLIPASPPKGQTPWGIGSKATVSDLPSGESLQRAIESDPPLFTRSGNRRHFMAFSEQGLFAKNFGGPEALDASGSLYADWETFLQGADRLVQHLKAHEYSGAFLTVAVDGSTLYPSTVLGSSPRLDTGLLSSNGADPSRKDVLELLFRLFEREGLTLIPAVVLNGPLPAIETARIQNAESSLATRPVHWNGSRGDLKIQDGFPIYNPLNPVVQSQVNQAIAEIAARYRRFECFGGIAIVCRPDTYAILPGQQWCCDVDTFNQYWLANQGNAALLGDREQLLQQILGPQQDRWLQWRAERMTEWYQTLSQTLQQQRPDAKLFLAPVDLYLNEEMAAVLSPNLHSTLDFAKQMLRIGWDVNQLATLKHVGLLKPRRLAPNQPLAANRIEASLENQLQSDAFFDKARAIGDLYVNRISWAHFSQLEQTAAFESQRSSIMRLQPLTPAGLWNRQRFLNSIRANDSQFLVDGGAVLSLGQETELVEFRKLFQRLPVAAFENVNPIDSITPNQTYSPVVVRQHLSETGLWFYAVNPSPWPCKVLLKLKDPAPNPLQIRQLSPAALQEVRSENEVIIELEMEPISLTGGVIEQGGTIESFRFELPTEAADPLRKQVHMLQSKLLRSTNSLPLDVLHNDHFEVQDQPSLSGWEMGQAGTQGISLIAENPLKGQACLRLKNADQSPVWIRSNSFSLPKTGRLSVSVWLRTADPGQQPPLRISIEGTGSETTYYRFGPIGNLSPDRPSNQLSAQWQRFAVHFDDLPIHRLSQVRIGLDLMGPGEVDVDQFEVFDRWFDERDAKAINQRLASSGPLLANPLTYESCRILLGSYWLRFLDEHFRDPTATQSADEVTGSSENSDDSDPLKPSSSSASESDVSRPSETKPAAEPQSDSNERGLFRRLRRGNRVPH